MVFITKAICNHSKGVFPNLLRIYIYILNFYIYIYIYRERECVCVCVCVCVYYSITSINIYIDLMYILI